MMAIRDITSLWMLPVAVTVDNAQHRVILNVKLTIDPVIVVRSPQDDLSRPRFPAKVAVGGDQILS